MTRSLPGPLREAFADWARDAVGMVFRGVREDSLEDAVRHAARELGNEPPALLDALRRGDRGSADALVSRLAVGETYFFRDAAHFDFLDRVLADARRPITIWSAGCASGAEPYSMAIVALERFGVRAAERVRIVATDIDLQALSQARAGRFRAWAMRGIGDARRDRWLKPEDHLWRLDPRVQELVEFRSLNLVAGRPSWLPAVDVVFCRNVLVYFDEDGVRRACATLRSALSDDGWLVPGPSDPLLSRFGFRIEPGAGFILYRPGAPQQSQAIPPATTRPAAQIVADRLASGTAVPAPRPRTPPPPTTPPAVASVPRVAAPHSLERAQSLADAGDTDAALAEIGAYLARHRLSAEGFLLRGLLTLSSGRPADARDDLRRALLLDRELAYAHLIVACCHSALGDQDAALHALRNCRAVASSRPPEEVLDPVSKLSAAELLFACRDMERALTR